MIQGIVTEEELDAFIDSDALEQWKKDNPTWWVCKGYTADHPLNAKENQNEVTSTYSRTD